MEWVPLAVQLWVFLLLGTWPGSESQNTPNVRDRPSKDTPTENYYYDRKPIRHLRRQDENEVKGEIRHSSYTDRLVRRYRYQGPVLGRKEKLKIQKGIVDEFIDAHQEGISGVVVDDLETETNNKSVVPQALPYKIGQGLQLDEALINKHFELLNDHSVLEECAQRQWTTWSAWSVCSAQCGFASRFQYRDCVFTDRVKGKKDCGYLSFKECKGKDMKRMECPSLPPCTEITAWGEWSDCSAVCQGKIGVRRRVMVKKSSRGTKTKMPEMTQVESCEGARPDCTGWSQWSRCTVSCSNQVGIRERTLVITTPEGFYKRDDGRLQMEPCVGHRILCEAWSSWAAWTSCDCKRRQRRRKRTCERRFVFMTSSIGIVVDNSLCHGPAQMSVSCTPVKGTCQVRPRRRKFKTKRGRPFLGSLKVKPKRLRPKRRVPGCVLGCQGLPLGRYPSCRSCFHYWQCYSRSRKERMCAKRRRWDNTARKCLPWSSTCPGF